MVLGPLETIWATIVKNNDGTIGDHQPNIPPETLGTSEAIGTVTHQFYWAHSRPSALQW